MFGMGYTFQAPFDVRRRDQRIGLVVQYQRRAGDRTGNEPWLGNVVGPVVFDASWLMGAMPFMLREQQQERPRWFVIVEFRSNTAKVFEQRKQVTVQLSHFKPVTKA